MDIREKNIEKLSSDLCDALCFALDERVGVTSVDAKATARRLYAAGYRKQNILVGDENAPPIEKLEVIRCKDCVYWEKARVNRKGFLICPITQMEIYASDYCSYAERKNIKKNMRRKKSDDL